MGGKSKKEYLAAILERYRNAGRKYKKIILDEFCGICGHHRKHAIRLLNARNDKSKDCRGRPADYGEKEHEVLERIWLAGNRPCSRRLKAMIPIWLPFYEQKYNQLDKNVRQNLLRISKNSIDRLLKPTRQRYGERGRSGTCPSTILRNQIPIKTQHWDVTEPGFMQADTVAHCGSSMEGDFAWSLTFTDIFSGWTENRAVWNKVRISPLLTRCFTNYLPEIGAKRRWCFCNMIVVSLSQVSGVDFCRSLRRSFSLHC